MGKHSPGMDHEKANRQNDVREVKRTKTTDLPRPHVPGVRHGNEASSVASPVPSGPSAGSGSLNAAVLIPPYGSCRQRAARSLYVDRSLSPAPPIHIRGRSPLVAAADAVC